MDILSDTKLQVFDISHMFREEGSAYTDQYCHSNFTTVDTFCTKPNLKHLFLQEVASKRPELNQLQSYIIPQHTDMLVGVQSASPGLGKPAQTFVNRSKENDSKEMQILSKKPPIKLPTTLEWIFVDGLGKCHPLPFMDYLNPTTFLLLITQEPGSLIPRGTFRD